ncbi:hypothetical protein CHS0354_008889 [Potamilus streckersoni]|uniref:Death domain-containing protein n=1 Tax=Potamilus streckersoni TaxID=2493646 RepID=A0AAE0TC64_9BIVA|nr:hypothetical protein CHS0354_008889 [Potamilus streckersoni]
MANASQQDLEDIFNRDPKDDELYKLSRCVGDWWQLAKELRLDDAEVERMREDYKSALERCYQVLRTWRNKYYGTAEGKVGFLVLACKQANVDQDKVKDIFKIQPR